MVSTDLLVVLDLNIPIQKYNKWDKKDVIFILYYRVENVSILYFFSRLQFDTRPEHVYTISKHSSLETYSIETHSLHVDAKDSRKTMIN